MRHALRFGLVVFLAAALWGGEGVTAGESITRAQAEEVIKEMQQREREAIGVWLTSVASTVLLSRSIEKQLEKYKNATMIDDQKDIEAFHSLLEMKYAAAIRNDYYLEKQLKISQELRDMRNFAETLPSR